MGVRVLAGACLSARPQGNVAGPSISIPTAQKGAGPLGTSERSRWPAEGTADKALGQLLGRSTFEPQLRQQCDGPAARRAGLLSGSEHPMQFFGCWPGGLYIYLLAAHSSTLTCPTRPTHLSYPPDCNPGRAILFTWPHPWGPEHCLAHRMHAITCPLST